MSKAVMVDIDAAARQAKRDASREYIDYVKHPDKLPVFPMGWQILMQPLAPKEQVGDILIARGAQDVEKIRMTIGMMVGMGPTALEGKTASGIVLKDLHPSLVRPSDFMGKYFMHQRYTGNQFETTDGDSFLLITVTELQALVPDPNRIRFWI